MCLAKFYALNGWALCIVSNHETQSRWRRVDQSHHMSGWNLTSKRQHLPGAPHRRVCLVPGVLLLARLGQEPTFQNRAPAFEGPVERMPALAGLKAGGRPVSQRHRPRLRHEAWKTPLNPTQKAATRGGRRRNLRGPLAREGGWHPNRPSYGDGNQAGCVLLEQSEKPERRLVPQIWHKIPLR